MKIIKPVYLLMSILFMVGCGESNSQLTEAATEENTNKYVVNCEITNAPSGKVFFEKINGQNFITKQTIEVPEDGKFTFEGITDAADFYRVRFYSGQFFFLVVDAGEITVKGDATKIFETLEVEGSNDSKVFNDFVLENSKKTTAMQQLQREYQQRAMSGDQGANIEYQQKYNQLAVENSAFLKNVIESNIESVIAPYLALSLDMEAEYAYVSEISNKINETQSNYYQQTLSGKVISMKALSIGAPAPEIELPNPEGQILKLSDLQGKVVLIDFWASWCRPCRAENPNVVRMYKQFKDKDFEILGVSLDKNKDAWVKAIQNDGITWPQVSDLQFWSSVAAKTYQVSSIPRTFLIDKEGNILAKNLRGAALESKLAEVLGE